METEVRSERYHAAHLAEEGEVVRLTQCLRVWRHVKEDVSWNIFKPWRTSDETLSVGTEGTVLERDTFLGQTLYTVQFNVGDVYKSTMVVEHIAEHYLMLVREGRG